MWKGNPAAKPNQERMVVVVEIKPSELSSCYYLPTITK